MESTVRIRLADKKDAALIYAISRRTFYDTFAVYNTQENMDLYLSQQLTAASMTAEVEDPENLFLLAYLEDQPVGYAQLRDRPILPGLEGAPAEEPEGEPAMEIVRLYAEQSTIGKGIGKALMTRCLEIAREKQKGWIWLGVWEHNQRAIGFYTKWGFEKFGEHVFMLGHDLQTDWEMKKIITPAQPSAGAAPSSPATRHR
ncbi:MAG TPA: GNAT family N-acetyltransferase [Puia sp.]|nr:GNAT family N-acetyltransferase [Puia sp.]